MYAPRNPDYIHPVSVANSPTPKNEDWPDNYEFPSNKLKQSKTDKTPIVVVACGSYSPVTYLHLRMFEIAADMLRDHPTYELVGGFFSPVSDLYRKKGLAKGCDRYDMCKLAVEGSDWIEVDHWEASQSEYQRTLLVLDHFYEFINVKLGGVLGGDNKTRKEVKIMLLAGGDLIESFDSYKDGNPVWAPEDLNMIIGKYGCVIIERTGTHIDDNLLSNESLYKHRKNIILAKQYIYNDISSTKIRLFVKRGMSIKYLLPDTVIDYIEDKNLFK